MELEELKEKFEEKINNELNEFKENLLQCEPKMIMDRAYELVSKEEMTYKITEKEYTKTEIKALLKRDGILDECYDEWLKSDGNFNEILEYAVDTRIDLILQDFKEKNRQKNKDSR